MKIDGGRRGNKVKSKQTESECSKEEHVKADTGTENNREQKQMKNSIIYSTLLLHLKIVQLYLMESQKHTL